MSSIQLALLFAQATADYSLPPKLLDSLCFVESSYRVSIIHKDDGGHNSVGVCQVQPRTARWLGYKGTDTGLLNPKTNITYAAKYLRYQMDRYEQDWVKAVAAYNAGVYRLNTSGFISNHKYVFRVWRTWHFKHYKR